MRLIIKQKIYLLYFLLLSIVSVSCNTKSKQRDLKKVTFKQVWGIKYTEVKRRHNNGRSFDRYGYQVDPSWQLTFLSDDSARIYATNTNSFANFHITNDHDSIFHVARTWLRAKKLTKDSLVLQVILVQSNIIYRDRSTVYMTFYADDYIKNVLKTTPAELQQPDAADTAFVSRMITHPHKDPDSLFAARNPVVFKSRHPMVMVSKTKVDANEFNNHNTADAYLRPEYNVLIKGAYKDFNYSFTAVVDDRGQIRLGKSLIGSYEDNTKVLKAIIDGYLKAYFDVTPGNTLGMPQSSKVYINVTGQK